VELSTVWFLLIAVLWTGYFVLEGFDFGVGMLLRPLARNDRERRVMLNTIGPVWDGNEVWLITAGGAMFAAFPEWYATLFSGFYLPLLVILIALIVRAVALEYRGKMDDAAWRSRADWGITLGSWLPAILWGVAFGNIVRGVAIDADKQVVSSFFELLNPYALLSGAVTALLFATHGAVFLALKTDDEVRERTGKLAARLAPIAAVVTGIWAIITQVSFANSGWTWAVIVIASAALVALIGAARARREGWAFVFSAVAILSGVVLLFGALFPNVMPSTLDPAYSLTVTSASATPYTLKIMTWVAALLTPVVMAYQGWTYWVFRKRISTKHIPDGGGLPADKKQRLANLEAATRAPGGPAPSPNGQVGDEPASPSDGPSGSGDI